MWEAIEANRSRSVLLLTLIGVVLLTLGVCAGLALGPRWMAAGFGGLGPELSGGLVGLTVAVAIWLGSWLFARFAGAGLILRSVGARRIEKQDHPRLWNVVEEMAIAAGLPQPPAVYIVDDGAPNAFAVGRDKNHGSVAFTTGLLRLMNRDELQGVAAHEIAHIVNEDIRFMTLAATLVGGVELLSRMIFHIGPFAGSGRRGSRGGSKGGHPAVMVAALLLAALAPLVVRLLYLACSRAREYLADASAARFTRYPEGLASALEKMAAQAAGIPAEQVNDAVAALYIVNPIEALKLATWASTHPPTSRRIEVLRGMGGRAGAADYYAALERIEKEKALLGPVEMAARTGESLAARTAAPEAPSETADRIREAFGPVDRIFGYIPLPCVCGLRVKVPPEFDRDEVECPACGRWLQVPSPEREATAVAASPAVSDGAPLEQRPDAANLPAAASRNGELRYVRKAGAWDAFRCECGRTINLGPSYPLDYTVCVGCDRRIAIATAARTPESVA